MRGDLEATLNLPRRLAQDLAYKRPHLLRFQQVAAERPRRMAAVPREAKIAAETAAKHSVATSQRSSRVGCPTVAQRLYGGGGPTRSTYRPSTQRCSSCFAYFDSPRINRRSTFISQAQAYTSFVIRMPCNYDKIYSGTSSYREVTNRPRTNSTCTANGESKALLAS
jgi:hypothetical protein